MRRVLMALTLLALTAGPARAQGDLLQSCREAMPSTPATLPSDVIAQFNHMCAQVVNSFSNMQPGIGIAFSGGNPVLGTGSTQGTRLGFLPRVSASLRANLALAEMPQLFDKYSSQISDSESLRPMPRVGVPLGSLQADLSVGLFNGMAFGLGAVDLLGSVAIVPKASDIGLDEAIVNYGAGARVGILKQGLIMPGVSVSGMYRKMGEIGFGDLATHPGSFSSDLSNLSLRAVASKGLLILDLAVGAGYDRYSSDLSLGWKVVCETSECVQASSGQGGLTLTSQIAGDVKTSAWNVFANAGLDLFLIKIVGELGYQRRLDELDASDLGEAGLPAAPLTAEDLRGGNIFGGIGVRLAL